MKTILLTILAATLVLGLTTMAHAQELEIPGWVKNNALWWAEGKISDQEYATALTYLAGQGIITIPQQPEPEPTGNDPIDELVSTFEKYLRNLATEINPDEYDMLVSGFTSGFCDSVIEEINRADQAQYDMLDSGAMSQKDWDALSDVGNIAIYSFDIWGCADLGYEVNTEFPYWDELE